MIRSAALSIAALAFALCGMPASVADAGGGPYSILHSFQGAEGNPQGALTSDGRGNLYGTTSRGGLSDGGTVFSVRTDGTGFRLLHDFAGGASDGFDPESSLVLDGVGNLYGTTGAGGPANRGTVFTIKEDGSGFEVLHAFAGGDGAGPSPALTFDGFESLYGTTSFTIFKLRTDGTGFRVLHTFTGGATDGRSPQGPLLLDTSGVLFGTTTYGGHPPVTYPHEGFFDDGAGTIYRIRTDGTGFQILRAFPVDANDGTYPSGLVTSDGSGSLYGRTQGGGSSIVGTVFRIGKDGSGFQILHSFAGSDGIYPGGSLVLDRSGNFYGMMANAMEAGGIFTVKTDATGYRILSWLDGSSPQGLLFLSGSGTFYGTTGSGGFSSSGTVFRINTDGSAFQILYEFAGFSSDGGLTIASVITDGLGNLYGTTFYGGSSFLGTVFKIKSDGTGLQLLHTFSGGPNDGAMPLAPLSLDRTGNLYGTTSFGGGSSGRGTVFKLRTDGSGFQLLHAFLGGADDGIEPVAALVLDDSGNPYGTTTKGGASGAGTVFRMRTNGSGFQLLHTFAYGSASDGAESYASLLLDGFGSLYGTTAQGGPSDRGTIFKLRTDGTGFRLLHAFVGGADDGLNPRSSLISDGSGSLYGTTEGGGPSSSGIIFKIATDGTSYQLVAGATKGGRVILDGLGNLYGTTSYGGPSNAGTVFTIRTDGTGLRILHSFGEGFDGRDPQCSLFLDGLGNLYGTTEDGGSANFGTIFTLSTNRHRPVVSSGPFTPVRKR